MSPPRLVSRACLLLSFLVLFAFLPGPALAWIDGTPLLQELLQGQLAPSPPSAPPVHAAPRFQIGDSRVFYAIDFRQQTQYTVIASLRAVGESCYIFVADDQWQRHVTAEMTQQIRRAFDEATPADPTRGIYEIERTAFGPPPDIDGDPRIVILLLDVRDHYLRDGGYVAGYFSPVNEQRGVVRDPNHGVPFRSNEMEMIYLDVDPLNPATQNGLSVLAHEFQHLIHWNYDTNEDVWVNEGCADYAVFLCGYDISEHVRAFVNEPGASLIAWNTAASGQLPHYGAAYLWTLYLHEHYGGERTIAAIIHEPRNGIAGVSAALSSRGYSGDFSSVFADWQLANYLNDPNFAGGRYSYQHEDLQLAASVEHRQYPVPVTSRRLFAWGADTIRFENGTGGGDLIVDLVEPLGSLPLQMRAVEFVGGKPERVRQLGLSKQGHGYLAVPQFGTRAEEVLLIVAFEPVEPADQVSTARYQYEARIGDQVSFQVGVIPNPVQPRYLDIVARASHRIGTDLPVVTLTEGEATLLSVVPMTVIQDGLLFGYALYMPPGRSSARISWRVEYLGALIGGGMLDEVAGP